MPSKLDTWKLLPTSLQGCSGYNDVTVRRSDGQGCSSLSTGSLGKSALLGGISVLNKGSPCSDLSWLTVHQRSRHVADFQFFYPKRNKNPMSYRARLKTGVNISGSHKRPKKGPSFRLTHRSENYTAGFLKLCEHHRVYFQCPPA